MEEGKPSKIVCYHCFHGDQLRFSFDNVVFCKRQEIVINYLVESEKKRKRFKKLVIYDRDYPQ